MKNTFLKVDDRDRYQLDWGTTANISGPDTNEAKDIVTIEVELLPGKGHDFHKHPQQEEVIYVLEGSVEQWVNQEKRILGPGDAAFIPADMVHASFNIGSSTARVLAILGPAVGADGYEVVEVAGESPWKDLR